MRAQSQDSGGVAISWGPPQPRLSRGSLRTPHPAGLRSRPQSTSQVVLSSDRPWGTECQHFTVSGDAKARGPGLHQQPRICPWHPLGTTLFLPKTHGARAAEVRPGRAGQAALCPGSWAPRSCRQTCHAQGTKHFAQNCAVTLKTTRLCCVVLCFVF